MERPPVNSGVQLGQVLAGKYKVDKILGTGGMGYVVACHHIQLNQKVALKFLHPSMLENPEIVGRFLREAQAAVQIKSEHVVRVSDVGTLDDGSPYMVMEYLEGTDLKEVLESQGPLPIATAVDYVLQACEALAEAHLAGTVHRDLKPNNLFLAKKPDGRPSVKVLDFGISKIGSTTPGVSNLTSTSATLGTPFYMAPEQLTSTRSVDVRADIWALGIVLYELISGATPFTGETLAELCIRIVQEQPHPLPEVNAAVPSGLWEVISRCLRKDREGRYANVAEVAFALAPYGTASAQLSLDTISRIIPLVAQTSPAVHAAAFLQAAVDNRHEPVAARTQTGTTDHVAWDRTSAAAGAKSHRPVLWVLGTLVVAAVGVVGWVLGSRPSVTAVGSGAPTAQERMTSTFPQDQATIALPAVTPVTTASAKAAPIASAIDAREVPVADGAKTALPSPRAADIKAQKRQGAIVRPGRAVAPNSEDLIDDRR